MDPNETARLLVAALERRRWDAAEAHANDLVSWLDRGGFPPLLIGSASIGGAWHRRIARVACLAALSLAAHERARRPAD